MKNIAAAAVALLLSASVLAAQAVPSADALLEQIHIEGARQVLWQLWDKPTEFGHVLSGIESGSANWLRVAAELREAADGAASLSLDYAVAQAIPHNPSGVLSLINNGFPLDMVCTSPFIEPEPGVAERYEHRALVALQSVQGSLTPLAAQCAAGIRLPKES